MITLENVVKSYPNGVGAINGISLHIDKMCIRDREYRIAILRDKLDYLGEEYCTPGEQKLAMLTDFPPLNYCCYPAVPAKYIVPIDDPWSPSLEALEVMEELAEEAGDQSFQKILKAYRLSLIHIFAL